MPKTSTRRTSHLTTPVMITFVVVALVMLGLTATSVVKAMSRGDDPVVVNEVLTGQSMEVNRTTGRDVIRFQSVRAPLPQDEDVSDTLDTCMAAESRDHLVSLADEGTSLDVEIEAYANAPNGELWAQIYQGGTDLGVQMVEAGFAVVDPESVDDPEKLDAMLAAQEKARHDRLGIFSTDADCTLPSVVQPVIDMLEDLPTSPPANDVTELTKYIGEMNSIRSDAQQTLAMLSAIPDTENDDSVAALAWGDAKQEYIDVIENHLDNIRELIEDAQSKRADLQDRDTPEPEPAPEHEDEDEPAEDQQSTPEERPTAEPVEPTTDLEIQQETQRSGAPDAQQASDPPASIGAEQSADDSED